MEFTGFVVLSTSSDGSDRVDAVKRSLYSFNHVEKESLVYGRGDRETCKRFITSGAEENNAFMERIQEVIGADDSPLLYQGPVVVASTEGHSAWPPGLAHPSDDAVSAFRDLANTKETRTNFRIYPPNTPREMTHEIQPVNRKLQPNEVLIIKGSVPMGIDLPPQGCFIWQGNSRRPMGHDMIKSGVFEFMQI